MGTLIHDGVAVRVLGTDTRPVLARGPVAVERRLRRLARDTGQTWEAFRLAGNSDMPYYFRPRSET
jgi:hypothetical protein